MRLDLTEFVPFFFYGGLSDSFRFGVILLLSTVADLVVADCLLFGLPPRTTRPGPIGFRRVLGVGSVLAAGFAVKVFLLFGSVGGFGMISILWYDLLIVGPWCGFRLAARARTGCDVALSVRVIASLSIAFLPVAAWARFGEPYRLQVERVQVPSRSAAAIGRQQTDSREAAAGPSLEGPRRPLRVAVLADIQTDRITAYEQGVVDQTLALNPDLILIPGDLYQGNPGPFQAELPAYRRLLSRLKAPGGVFFVQGDVDPPTYVDALLQDTGIRWLKDEVVQVEVAGRTVYLAGLLRSLSVKSKAAVAELEALPHGAIKLVVCHYGRAVFVLDEDSDVDLVIGGHTHGGQIVIPFFDPPLTLSRLPRRVGAGGLHRVGGHRVYVSRGIGMERGHAPRVRLFCPPELTILEFE